MLITKHLTGWQKLNLYLSGRTYLDHRQLEGWSGPLPFYAVKCPEHGIFEDYPHGYNGRFDCPKCLEESTRFCVYSDTKEEGL